MVVIKAAEGEDSTTAADSITTGTGTSEVHRTMLHSAEIVTIIHAVTTGAIVTTLM